MREKAIRRTKLLVALAGLMSFAAASAPVSHFKIIANSAVKDDRISIHELKNVYLGRSSSLADGTRVEPVLARGGAAHEAFLRECLGQNSEQLQLYYRTLVSSGKASMPKEVNSEAEMVAYVSHTRNAIGYVNADTNTEGLKTLSLEGAVERQLVTRVEPEYPEILRKNHIGGIVRLAVTVAANGKVEKIDVLGGNPALVEPAEAAVRRWVYSPGSRTVIEVSISFR